MNRRRLLQELTAISPILWRSRLTLPMDPPTCGEVVIDPCSFRTATDPASAAGAALRAAVAALPTEGGSIRLLPGTFQLEPEERRFGGTSVSAGLWLPSNVQIAGSGPSTVLAVVGSSGGCAIANADFASGNERLVIRDLMVVGRSASSARPGGYFSPPTTDQYRHHGILLVNAHHFAIERVEVQGVWGAGFYLANLGPEYSTSTPSRYSGPSDGSLVGCHAAHCGSYGFWLNGEGTSHILISQCQVEDVGGGPLLPKSFSGGHGVLFDSNVFFCRLETTQVLRAGRGGGTGHGIFLTVGCSFNQIHGCLVNDAFDTGISVGSGCRQNRVGDCHVQNVGGATAYAIAAPPSANPPTGNQLLNCSADANAGAACFVIGAPATQVVGLLAGADTGTYSAQRRAGPSIQVERSPGTLLSNLTVLPPTRPERVPQYAVVADHNSVAQSAERLEGDNALFRGSSGVVLLKP
jgi:hypothetical protein